MKARPEGQCAASDRAWVVWTGAGIEIRTPSEAERLDEEASRPMAVESGGASDRCAYDVVEADITWVVLRESLHVAFTSGDVRAEADCTVGERP